jgi:hypothetical protein
MSKSTHPEPPPTAQSVSDNAQAAAGFTRRTVLAGAAVTAATAISIDAPVHAQSADPMLDAFVTLSAALTGIARDKLAPATDSLELKRDYFNWVNAKEPANFASLLQIVRAAALQIPDPKVGGGVYPQADVDKLVRLIEAKEETKFLARSIVLMWYLGSWYAPEALKSLTRPGESPFIPHTVISPKAYTQGWVWRVAQAHPMGYSELQFGYWTREPEPLAEFIFDRAAKGS